MPLNATDDEFGELYGDLADNLGHCCAVVETSDRATLLGVDECLDCSGESSESEDDLRIVLNDDDYVDDGDEDEDDDLVVIGTDANMSSDRKPNEASASLKALKSCSSASFVTSQNAVNFSLPRNRTIFDVCIESFDRKPWRQQGVDISNYFNFGLDEDRWKSYCESMEMLRQQATGLSHLSARQSSKHRGTRRGMPNEAAGGCWTDRTSSVTEHIDNTSPEMTRGRPIQAESVFVERISSMDLRRTRLRDPDVVIQIPIEDSAATEAVPCTRDLEHSDQEKIKDSALNFDNTSPESMLADTESRQYSSVLCNPEVPRSASKGSVGENLKLDFTNCNGEGSSKLEPSCDDGSPADQAIFSGCSDFDLHSDASESYDLKNKLSSKIVSSESINSSIIKSSFGCSSDSEDIGDCKSRHLEVFSRKHKECSRSNREKLADRAVTPFVGKEGSESDMGLQNNVDIAFGKQRETSVDYRSRKDRRRHKERYTKAFYTEDDNGICERILKKRGNLHLRKEISFWHRRKEDMPFIGTLAKQDTESSPRYKNRRLQGHANGSPLIYRDRRIPARGSEGPLRCRDNSLHVIKRKRTIYFSGEEESFCNELGRGFQSHRKSDERYSGLSNGTDMARENGASKTKSFGHCDHWLRNYGSADEDIGQNVATPPRHNSTISWRSCEQYLDEERSFAANQKISWRGSHGHNSNSKHDSYHCARHEHGIELQYHKHLGDERNLYLEKKRSGLHRSCQLISEIDDGFFRHQEALVFATADSLCGSARSNDNCVDHYLLSDCKFLNHNSQANGRERMIVDDDCHSDGMEDSRFIFDNFGKRRHEFRSLGRKEAVKMRLNGVKRKFFHTFEGSTVGRRPHTNNEAVKTMPIVYESEVPSYRPAFAGRPDFLVNIETFQALQLKHSDRYWQRKTRDNIRSMDNYEDDEIEEGQLAEECGGVITKKLSSGKEISEPASKASASSMKVKKVQSKELTTDKGKSGDGDNLRLLEMLAKMEKRRERFKDPLALDQGEGKNSKVDVSSSVMPDNAMQQRPARKRRWACS